MIPPGHPVPARPSIVRPPWSVAGPALGTLLAAGLVTAPIGTLAGSIQRELGLSTVPIIVTVGLSYVVAMAALVAPGYLLGRRWPTATAVPALVLLILGSLVSSFAPGAPLLLVGRLFCGLGAGLVVGVGLALCGQLGRWRSRARLALGITLGVGLLLGPVTSSVVAQTTSWRLVFLVDVPMAAVALAAAVAGGIAMSVLRTSRPGPWVAPATTTPLPGPATQHADSPPR